MNAAHLQRPYSGSVGIKRDGTVKSLYTKRRSNKRTEIDEAFHNRDDGEFPKQLV